MRELGPSYECSASLVGALACCLGLLMNRRLDQKTAEIVDIVLLTRNAFGLDRALRYVALAKFPKSPLYRVLGRPEKSLRNRGKHAGLAEEGRRRRPRG